MNILLRFGLAVLVIAAIAPVSCADVLDAPTGTYTGTLTYERSLTLKGTVPPRTVKHKTITRVTGFGYVPAGASRTFIRLILPAHNVFDMGVDRQITLDFQQDPVLLGVIDGEGTLEFNFANVTVKDKVVTCVISVSASNPDYDTQDLRTLRLTRTKP